jgi:hypothetical protein
MSARARGARLLRVLLLVLAGCRARPPTPTPAAAPNERAELLARIQGLDEVAPCLADAGQGAIRIVDAELAGDAATVTFACANGAASGRVTFFRVAGTWTISTKEIAARNR